MAIKRRGLSTAKTASGKIRTLSSTGLYPSLGRHTPRLDKNFSIETKNKSALRSKVKKRNK